MPKFIDLTGQTFTRLTVVSQANHIGKYIAWNCVCECGNDAVVKAAYLRCGDTKSCGCLDRDAVVLRNTSHGMAHEPSYKTWSGVIQRCNNTNNPDYWMYGGRGVSICDRWLKFENFYADMGDRPSGMSIDRIDVNGPYSPENCRWATNSEQANNKRNNHLVSFAGRSQTMPAWARELGISRELIKSRLSRGWSIEASLTTPVTPTGKHRIGIPVGVLGSSITAPLQQ